MVITMKTVCDVNKCAGCMACVDICPKEAISIEDSISAYNAVIDESKCTNCGACNRICQKNHPYQSMKPMKWYQGWAKDEKIREKSSSGGFATAIAKAFVLSGGIVCSCIFEAGEFRFGFAKTEQEVEKFTGSKYVKSNPQGIYKKINQLLKNNERVLFIGLPCQVAALRNFVNTSFSDNLYTADLICHGTPSPKLLDMFLNQYKRPLKSMSTISFRVNAKMQVHGDGKGIITKGVSDKYTIAFLDSLTYTDNCYECDYAKLERVSDLTLGDSWGSELPMDVQKKGVSLALAQTTKGIELLENAELELKNVDLKKAIENNHQLEHPSIEPKNRRKFLNNIKSGKSFNKGVFMNNPKYCLKQDVKEIMIKLNMLH